MIKREELLDTTTTQQTRDFIITLDKTYTVKDIVQFIKNYKDEWGDITIDSLGSVDFKEGRVSYIPKELLKLEVSKVRAHGGWSYMSYTIITKDNG